MDWSDLPELLRFENGIPLKHQHEWRDRREEIEKLVLENEYGRLPPVPSWTRGELLYTQRLENLHHAHHSHYRILTGSENPFHFILELYVPDGVGPFPVVLNGDGCWRYINDEVLDEVIGRNYILAVFNRVTIVPDDYRPERDQGLYLAIPDRDYGALAAWAWGYHRCVDFLLTLPTVDLHKIIAVGHSRGGKTALLAGATDERIALTAPNNSGCGGAGCFRIQGEGSETLADILRLAPNWFTPRLSSFIDRESMMPFDQHFLKALVAPCALLSTEALGDLWANPTGTWHTHMAARQVYKFLGADAKIGILYRQGGHNHGIEDWRAMLDFADWQFFGKSHGRNYQEAPDTVPAGRTASGSIE